ncbi:MAG TPA: phosphoenolpyruvate carboxykinase [Armatimonadota bacterium]
MPLQNLEQEGNQLILHTSGVICSTTRELASSDAFESIVQRYIAELLEHDSPLLSRSGVNGQDTASVSRFIALLRTLAVVPMEQVVKILPYAGNYLDQRKVLLELVEGLYNFWRSHDRFMICHSEQGPNGSDQRPYRTFNATAEQLTHLVRALYRDICENITGDHPRVYRQVSAGCEFALIATERSWPCPAVYSDNLEEIPFIRQVLLNPPVILTPPMNKRTGQFKKVNDNPLLGLSLEKDEWLCYPAQVGPLVVFIYVHQSFIGLGCSLANLFELATDEQIAAGPDAIYLYGAPPEGMTKFGDLPTVFYDDDENGVMVAAVPNEDRFGYFGYIKKMVLTLHNAVMMKRGRMPFHGALVKIELKNGNSANVLLIGDTAAGKSESLEAFRVLGTKHIRGLRVIADDMGSLEVPEDGRVIGYGTEIGAFIRLDDLQHGYAFGQIDRAIIHNPHLVNARVILPVTTLDEVLAGCPIDFLLYANNYEGVDEDHPIIERLPSAERALETFRDAAAMAKGTTTSTGLVHTYFANSFGAPQYRELHDGLARRTFESAYEAGVYVGQLRTRLGISGYEALGPQEAATALFELISTGGGV